MKNHSQNPNLSSEDQNQIDKNIEESYISIQNGNVILGKEEFFRQVNKSRLKQNCGEHSSSDEIDFSVEETKEITEQIKASFQELKEGKYISEEEFFKRIERKG